MSNAIIKQQGDSPIVADNIWELRLGAGPFILGALAGTLVTAAVGQLTAKGDATPRPPTPRGWPINLAHRSGAKVVPERNTIEGFREGFAVGGGVVECDIHASADGTIVVIHNADLTDMRALGRSASWHSHDTLLNSTQLSWDRWAVSTMSASIALPTSVRRMLTQILRLLSLDSWQACSPRRLRRSHRRRTHHRAPSTP
jgi:Glycerophosphoryl diester phosphodiesterase family